MRWDVVTFDCYGTLIDWEEGIGSALERAARAAGVSIDRQRALELYAAIEPQIQSGPFKPYRQVLDEAAARVAEALGFEPGGPFLADSLAAWRPFADTAPALERLSAAGLRLGILSNVDDDLLAATRRRLPVAFELVVTAQQVGSYKPAPGHFQEARRRLTAAAGDGRWLHVAQSLFHDVVPAQRLGVPAAWINRKAEQAPPEVEPVAEFPELAAFVDWLLGTA